MHVKLVRHNFKDDPNWQLIESNVPIGTVYKVLAYDADTIIENSELKKRRKVKCYYVTGNGGEGWLPCDVFELLN